MPFLRTCHQVNTTQLRRVVVSRTLFLSFKTMIRAKSSTAFEISLRRRLNIKSFALSSASFSAMRRLSSSSVDHMQNLIVSGFPLATNSSSNGYASTGKWILTTAGLVIGMIHVGGITRLTQSGLSMTDWSVTGSLPPLTETDWIVEFNKYKQYPEWQQRQSMTLDEFKYIYAWEYGHRMFGRLIGIVFLGPWLYFTVKNKIPLGYQSRMALLGTMGATQGMVGWWMVKSGLGDDRRNETKEIRVKPARLATHLSMAVATYGALVWTGLDILTLHHRNAITNAVNNVLCTASHPSLVKEAVRMVANLRTAAIAVTGLTVITIVSGALVAGNDAGRAYNTYPMMGDEWIPSDSMELVPWYRNFTENTALVQFNHRLLGGTTAFTAIILSTHGLLPRPGRPISILLTPQVRNGLTALGFLGVGQYALGVTALVTYVPLSLAALHQMGSIAVFTSCVYLVHSLKYVASASTTRALVARAGAIVR